MAIIVTFCSLYAAQPLQPLFQSGFHLTPIQALLFTTLMMAPLGIASLFYGYLLDAETICTRNILDYFSLLEKCNSGLK